MRALMERLKLFLPLVVFVILAAIFFGVERKVQTGDYSPTDLPSALLDRPLPAFSLAVLGTDQTLTREDILGQWFLLNVWATWCPTCHYEHPFLMELAERGARIYSVDYKDSATDAQRWLEDKGDPYVATLFDPQGKFGLDLGVTGAPETYLVDSRGIVRLRYQGALDQNVWATVFEPRLAELREGGQ